MAFVDLCRLCGADTLNILRNPIFEGEGREKKYALKIAECLTLLVSCSFFPFNFWRSIKCPKKPSSMFFFAGDRGG
jgi:hypothetical protein